MKPRIQLTVKWADGRRTDVQIDGDMCTPAMFEAAKDLAHTLMTGKRLMGAAYNKREVRKVIMPTTGRLQCRK
jgi:hypothetical protein